MQDKPELNVVADEVSEVTPELMKELQNRAFAGRHSMDSPEWFTPPEIVGPAYATLLGIDLDPASHEEANVHIRAKRIYTAETNGLVQPWAGKVFINPPGGLVADFWKKLLEELPNIEAAIWIGYSLEQLQTLQRIPGRTLLDRVKTPLDFPMCVPNRRISFIESKAKEAERVKKVRQVNAERVAHGLKPKSEKKGGPSHANYITYIGKWVGDFAKAFRTVGQVTIPR